ncbi:hypothetical protein HK098_007994 [Nowakowskiella sp. JEL0407]|nr:hypothetical protein HK098_007994 [Nowakowskiella sp. JEL0407]
MCGTRGVGKEFVKLALADGHNLTILARNVPPASDFTNDKQENLLIVHGNALDKESLAKVIAGQDIIFCSLGALAGSGDNVCSLSAPLIVETMNELGVSKLIVVTSYGCGDSWAEIPFFIKPMFFGAIGATLKEKTIQEDIILKSNLEYMVIRPTSLKDGPPDGNYSFGPIRGKQISRGNVALFASQQLTGSDYWGKKVKLTEK